MPNGNLVNLLSVVLYDTAAASYETSIECSRRLHARSRPKWESVGVGDGSCQTVRILSLFILLHRKLDRFVATSEYETALW
jgi:hypothetical protein